MDNKIVKNSKYKSCRNPRCGGVHEYLSRNSEDARCGTPVAFSAETAERISRLMANGPEDVVEIPNDTIVILDDSARRLPRGPSTVALDQGDVGESAIRMV